MTASWFKEEFARRGLIQAGDPVLSGSPAVLVLRPGDVLAEVTVIPAVMALVRRGLSVIKAKRFVEDSIDDGRAVVTVPSVESETTLSGELRAAGFVAAFMAREPVDVRKVRERLALSQEQFAARFGLEVDSVQNWETGRRQPDTAVQSYLKVIAALPDEVSAALEKA